MTCVLGFRCQVAILFEINNIPSFPHKMKLSSEAKGLG